MDSGASEWGTPRDGKQKQRVGEAQGGWDGPTKRGKGRREREEWRGRLKGREGGSHQRLSSVHRRRVHYQVRTWSGESADPPPRHRCRCSPQTAHPCTPLPHFSTRATAGRSAAHLLQGAPEGCAAASSLSQFQQKQAAERGVREEHGRHAPAVFYWTELGTIQVQEFSTAEPDCSTAPGNDRIINNNVCFPLGANDAEGNPIYVFAKGKQLRSNRCTLLRVSRCSRGTMPRLPE